MIGAGPEHQEEVFNEGFEQIIISCMGMQIKYSKESHSDLTNTTPEGFQVWKP
jgi:hypothetical protein